MTQAPFVSANVFYADTASVHTCSPYTLRFSALSPEISVYALCLRIVSGDFVYARCLRRFCNRSVSPEILYTLGVSGDFCIRSVSPQYLRRFRIRSVSPEISVDALQSGNFCIPRVSRYVWMLVSRYSLTSQYRSSLFRTSAFFSEKFVDYSADCG